MMNQLMKAAVLHAPGDLRIEHVRMPSINEDEVLVKVKAAGVCGSDLDRIMKTGTYRFPTIPGHEFSGEVVKVGSRVSGIKEGSRVVVAPILPCYKCDYCQQGYYGQCDNYNYLGSRTDGGFAQYVKVPAGNLITIPEGVTFIEGAATEPAAVTLHGMRKASIEAGDTVAVLGCGAIGLFAVQFAKIMGATNVLAVDIAADKLDLAGRVGADFCINAAERDPVETIKELTGDRGVNVAVETAGVSQTQEQSLRITKKQGRVLYLGTAHKDVVIPARTFEFIIRNELRIVGSWNSYSAPFPGVEWHATLKYIQTGVLKIKPLISHTFELDKAPEVIGKMAARKFSFNKVLFVFE